MTKSSFITCPFFPSRRDIPASSYMMHSLHCARNIALCTVCDEPVPRAELEQHKQEFHSSKQCPDCGEMVEASKMEEHKTSLCQRRVEICPFCALNQEVSEMKAHMDYCGSRTEKCEECKEIIMLRNWEMHVNSNHTFIKLKDGKADVNFDSQMIKPFQSLGRSPRGRWRRS